MKKQLAKNSTPRVGAKSQRAEEDLAWAEGLNGHATRQISQLLSIAQLIASGNPDGSQHTETDRTDLLATMTLFAQSLGHVADILCEVGGIIRQHTPESAAINT
ncbi:MAG: hypothetical protein LZF60_360089 [Nitrospira sp.]|nr:MAG: hypothetical protein LZF60_360089 [Nitrospira sp.]